MARRFTAVSIFLLLTGACGFGQMIPGMGYPGGGRRRPQSNPQPTQTPTNNKTTLTGMLRRLGDSNIVIESDDAKMTTVLISKSTKYLKLSGGKTTSGDFQPGDHVSVSIKTDSKGDIHAESVGMVKEGTPDEHSAASVATNDVSRPLNPNPVSRASADSGNSSSPSSASRPTLSRAPSSSGSSSDAPSAPASTSNSSGSGSSDDGHPRLRRASSAGASSPPLSTNEPATPQSATVDSSTIARVPPPTRSLPQQDSVADNDAPVRPVLRRAGNGSSDAPMRIATSNDEIIDRARAAASEFSESLPNYIVKQYTTRYATAPGRRAGGGMSWQALDNVTADVIEENGVEKYKNILINGKPPLRDVEKSGSWSKGEFSSLLQDVLSLASNAEFTGKRSVSIVNRAAFEYQFTVQQPNSHWHVEVDSGDVYMPGYSGSIWIDKENFRVLRIEMSAERLPTSFGLDQVEWAVDYDYVLISEGKYLLPVHSETLSCERGTNQCSRNVIDFRNYRKFTADTSISFEPNQ